MRDYFSFNSAFLLVFELLLSYFLSGNLWLNKACQSAATALPCSHHPSRTGMGDCSYKGIAEAAQGVRRFGQIRSFHDVLQPLHP